MDIGVIPGVFIAWPFLALIPCGVFALMYWRSRQSAVLVAALAWLAYFPYEQAMKMRLLCSGECNIRVDLLLLYPLLAVASALAVSAHVKWSRRGRRA